MGNPESDNGLIRQGKNSDVRLEYHRQRVRESYWRNREQHIAKRREWYTDNKEEVNAKSRKCYADNKEEARQKARESYQRNRERALARSKKYQKDNADKKDQVKQRRWNREYRARLKLEVIKAYGGCCVCCGESEPAFLSIDHTNHDGHEHRKAVNGSVYVDLKKRGWPKDGFALKCMNCNFAEAFGRVCPHKTTQIRATGT